MGLAQKVLLSVEVPEAIQIKSINRDQVCTCVSGRPFSPVAAVCERARIPE